jgi:hypothetical protein
MSTGTILWRRTAKKLCLNRGDWYILSERTLQNGNPGCIQYTEQKDGAMKRDGQLCHLGSERVARKEHGDE